MVLLLDTQAWVWLVVGNTKIHGKLRHGLEKVWENKGLGISVISIWEIAQKCSQGKIRIDLPIDGWVEKATNALGIKIIPITPRIAIESTRLPGDFHKDPADRMIVASAREFGIPLVTSDGAIKSYGDKGYIKYIGI